MTLLWVSLPSAQASALVIPNTFVANTPILSAAVNANFTTVATVVNSLDNSNIATGAAINPAKLSSVLAYPFTKLAAATDAMSVGNTGDTVARFKFNSDGYLYWGPGGASAVDVMLKRHPSVTGLAVRNAADTTGGTIDALTVNARTVGAGTDLSGLSGIFQLKSSTGGSMSLTYQNTASSTATEVLYPSNATSYLLLGVSGSVTAGGMLWGDGTAIRGQSPSFVGGSQVVLSPTSSAAPTYLSSPICAGGRLTLTTVTPVTSADTTSSTLYYTPYIHDTISLPGSSGGGDWQCITFNEVSISLPNTSSQMYDVFGYNNSGALALEFTAWTNDTTRATSLTLVDGVPCKTGTLSRRYLGSVRTNTTLGQTSDRTYERYVWNYQNRVNRSLYAQDTTASWTYNTATWRAANASSVLGVGATSFIIGLVESLVTSTYEATFGNTAAAAESVLGINLDSTSATPGNTATVSIANTTTRSHSSATYSGYPAIGYHYLQNMENRSTNSATNTWYGVQPTTTTQETYQHGTVAGM